ncbi:uncharacterized protein [Haliotis asinina]|uniref:uncharacterized protein n=1 Tax=Haliotis asinina TaxID=109174 RepID=UPI00353267E0
MAFKVKLNSKYAHCLKVDEYLTEHGFQLLPNQNQMDFEVASKNAVMSVFPGYTGKGCFFHFTQCVCVWRKAQQFGLQIDDVWLQTLAVMPQDRRCEQLADYVTTQWIEGDQAPPVWNSHDTEGPRTNNHLEGWHGRLKKIIAKAHPNIFEFVRFLIGEQKKNEILLVQYAAGQRLPPKKKKYQDVQRRLERQATEGRY